jgi:hypothetical protein
MKISEIRVSILISKKIKLVSFRTVFFSLFSSFFSSVLRGSFWRFSSRLDFCHDYKYLDFRFDVSKCMYYFALF